MIEWKSDTSGVFSSIDRDNAPYVLAFYIVVATLLTWPILLRPGQAYLVAPSEYYVFQSQEEWGLQWTLGHHALGTEFIDHQLHTGTLEKASRRFKQFEFPTLVHSDYTVPPTYVLLGGFVTAFLPFPTFMFHSFFFVTSMFLAGLFTYLLVREIVGDPEVAMLAGFLYMSSFYLYFVYTLGHTNQWQIQWIPLILFGLERISADFEARNVLVLTSGLALQALSSEQYTVYLTFIVPLYIVLRYLSGANKYRRIAFWKGMGVTSTLSLLVVSPYVASKLLMAGGGSIETRSIETSLYHWYVIEQTNVVGVLFAPEAKLQLLFRLGLLVLGIIGLAWAPRRRQRQLIPFAVLFVGGITMAWGPIAEWAPYTLVYKYWPLVEYFRVPYRMLPFALLGSSTLSAAILLTVSEPGDGWTQRGRAVILTVVVVQLALVHYILQFSGYTV